MRRLARIFVNLLAVTSVLLSLVVGWLWVRGYTSYDDLGVVTTSKTADYRADRHYALGSQVGGLTWQITTYEWTTPKAVAGAWTPEGTSFCATCSKRNQGRLSSSPRIALAASTSRVIVRQRLILTKFIRGGRWAFARRCGSCSSPSPLLPSVASFYSSHRVLNVSEGRKLGCAPRAVMIFVHRRGSAPNAERPR